MSDLLKSLLDNSLKDKIAILEENYTKYDHELEEFQNTRDNIISIFFG